MEARTALVVDPCARTRESVKRALRRRGYRVVGASSRAAASDLLDGIGAHVLVLEDGDFPGRSGRGRYRVVWLSEEARADALLEPTREGWRRFDLGQPLAG